MPSRARLRAELDGWIAHLYGLTEEDFTHVLATFPVVDAAVKEAAFAAYRVLAPNLAEPQRTKSRTLRRPRSPEARG